VLRAAGDISGQTIVVFGAGMLGLTACAFARSRGADRIAACDIDPSRLALAGSFGADAAFDSTQQADTCRAFIAAGTDGRGADVALELSGSSEATSAALDLLRIGGRLILAGAVFPTPEVAFQPESIVRRLLRIEGVHNYHPGDLTEAVRFLALNHERFPFHDLLAKTFDLNDAPAALEYAERERPVRVAVVMTSE
jgi:alcohol dehydrogenase